MEIDKNALAQTYSTKSDDELLDLHAAGTLTEMAYEVLEAELACRGIATPKHPKHPEVLQERPQSLRAHWEGKASLTSAYWFAWVLSSIVLGFLFQFSSSLLLSLFKPQVLTGLHGSLLVHPAVALTVTFTSIWFLYSIFASVSVWQHIWNSDTLTVIFTVISTFIWLLYSIFASVSVWRCAWNSNWRGWGYIARIIVILNVVSITAIVVWFAISAR